jgi:flagellar assembly protein FliH
MNKQNIQSGSGDFSKWETPRLINSNLEDMPDPQSDEEIKAAAFEENRKLGYQAGLDQASKEVEEKTALLTAYLEAFSQPFMDQNYRLAEDIAALAGKIAKSLVRRELRTEPETIMALVRDTVAALNTSTQKINIHLHPENARVIREIIIADSPEQSWSIVDDPLISRSDCKVSSNDSLVDADLETRIDLIITQFLGDERGENRA